MLSTAATHPWVRIIPSKLRLFLQRPLQGPQRQLGFEEEESHTDHIQAEVRYLLTE